MNSEKKGVLRAYDGTTLCVVKHRTIGVWSYQQEPQIGVGDNSNRLTELQTGLGAYNNTYVCMFVRIKYLQQATMPE